MSIATEEQGRIPADTLPNRLVLIRRELGWSQREAAFACGLTFGEWQGMENGRKVTALDEKVQKIARASGYSRDYIIWGGALAPPPNGGPGQRAHLDSNQKPFGLHRPLRIVSQPVRRVSVSRTSTAA